jgi:phosphohistidine phosphatase SixA
MQRLLAALVIALWAGCACAQTLSGEALVKALQGGGYVLLMRHAASPMALPDAATAEPDNVKGERQLDATGKATAKVMGDAFKAMKLPIGKILSSPTYRALQTARIARLPTPLTALELGEGTQGMQGSGAAPGSWLVQTVSEPPRTGTDTVLITHFPNIRAAYPDYAQGLADGETLVFRPGGAGKAELVARVKIEDWPALGAGR